MAHDTEKKQPKPERKSIDWDYCPEHGKPFPKGSTCPRCDAEQRDP